MQNIETTKTRTITNKKIKDNIVDKLECIS